MLAYPLAAALALQTLACVAQTGPHYVDRCDPCSIVLRNGTPPADFRFEVETVPQGRAVRVIIFERGGHTMQKLDVSSMTPLAKNESFFFGGQDINFDGWLDLLLMTEQGSANAKAEYWLYDPAADRFRDLGEFPMLRVDPLHNRLTSYVSNGPAGLDFEKRDYAFEGKDLVVTSEETRKPSPRRPGWYVHTVRRLKHGKLVLISRQTVKLPPPPKWSVYLCGHWRRLPPDHATR
jgi:hypothetical protein